MDVCRYLGSAIGTITLLNLLYQISFRNGVMNCHCLLILLGLSLMPDFLPIFMALKASGLFCFVQPLPSLIFLKI